MQKRQNCVSIIIRQQKCNEKYDSVDIATTIVKRSFSKHLCLVEVNLKKSCIFPQSIFKKMPPGTPRNRIRDFSWATLLVVKGFPKQDERPAGAHHSSVTIVVISVCWNVAQLFPLLAAWIACTQGSFAASPPCATVSL